MSDQSPPPETTPPVSQPMDSATADAISDGRDPSLGQRAKFKKLLSSESVQGALKLTGGSGLAQLIAIAAAPVVTRLYSPSDYGALAIFTSVSAILIAIATGKYELAVMLPEDDDEATTVAGIALILSTVTALVTLIGVGVLHFLYEPLSESVLGTWIFLIPLTVLMGGWSAVFVAYATRRGEFGLVATMGVLRQVIGSTTSIGLGFLKVGAGGLIVGGFLSISSANLRLGRPVFLNLKRQRPTRTQLVDSARRYRRFPQQTLPAVLLNTGYLNGLPLLVGVMFGSAILGVYALASRIVTLPARIVGAAVGQTYYRRAAALTETPSEARRLFDRTALTLALLSIGPFVFVAAAAPTLFGIVFGPEWSDAGVYTRIMLPMLWVQFVTSPVSTTHLVYGKNYIGLLGTIAQASAIVVTAVAATLLQLPFEIYLGTVTLTICPIMVIAFIMNRRAISAIPTDS